MNTSRYSDLAVAIVGYGSIGRRHAENLRSIGVNRLVIVRRNQNANPAFGPPADAIIVHDVHTAIERGVDLAIVCNPTQMHAESAAPFLAAGIPALIEKPVAANVTDARRLQTLAEKHGVFSGAAYCMRYHPAYARAHEAIHQGRLGRVLYAKAWFESWLPDWHPWEDYRQSYAARRDLGGGVLPTLDHEIDFLNWCLGLTRVVTGRSHRSGVLDIDVDEAASLMIEYPRGVTASCQLSFCRRDRQRGFEFIGSEASLRFSLETNQLLLCRGDEQQLLWDGRGYDLNQMYVDLLDDFLDALAAGRQPPIPLESGIAALDVASRVGPASLRAPAHH